MQQYRFLPRLIDVTAGIVEAILGFRLVLKLFAANPAAPFVEWIYRSSDPLVEPFRGMFVSPRVDSGSILEFSTLFAIMVYALAAFYVTQLVNYTVSSTDKEKV